jgi:hypothetical protein
MRILFMPTPLDHLRFRLAFSPTRRVLYRYSTALAFALAASTIGATLDYQNELRLAREQALEAVAHTQHALLTCLNGGSPGWYTTTASGHRAYIVCGEPFTITDENTAHSVPSATSTAR